jgi:hypothetical protein
VEGYQTGREGTSFIGEQQEDSGTLTSGSSIMIALRGRRGGAWELRKHIR